MADYFFENKSHEGLALLGRVFDASFDVATGDFFAMSEYISDLIQELREGKYVGSKDWFPDNIGDKELFEKVYGDISSKLPPDIQKLCNINDMTNSESLCQGD